MSCFYGCMGIPPELYFSVFCLFSAFLFSSCTLTCLFLFCFCLDRCANHKLLISFKTGRLARTVSSGI